MNAPTPSPNLVMADVIPPCRLQPSKPAVTRRTVRPLPETGLGDVCAAAATALAHGCRGRVGQERVASASSFRDSTRRAAGLPGMPSCDECASANARGLRGAAALWAANTDDGASAADGLYIETSRSRHRVAAIAAPAVATMDVARITNLVEEGQFVWKIK